MRVLADALDGANPFTLLADGVPGARMAMGEQTLVVVGAEFAGRYPGFIILTDQVNLANGDNASGEERTASLHFSRMRLDRVRVPVPGKTPGLSLYGTPGRDVRLGLSLSLRADLETLGRASAGLLDAAPLGLSSCDSSAQPLS
jgi:hypothetical protein